MPIKIAIVLTEPQREILLELFSIAFAGDTSEGDYSWSQSKYNLAKQTCEIIANAQPRTQQKTESRP